MPRLRQRQKPRQKPQPSSDAPTRRVPLLFYFVMGYCFVTLPDEASRILATAKLYMPSRLISASALESIGTVFQLVEQQQQQPEQQPPVVVEVAYVISVPHCKPNFRRYLFDSASVLRRSIELNSYPLHTNSRYTPSFYAIVTPHVAADLNCGGKLTDAGFALQVHDFPVKPEDLPEVEGSILKREIGVDGCCGHTELLKLHAWSMSNHTVAVHMDLDILMTQPLDELFNAIHFSPHTPQGTRARQHLVDAGLVAPTYQPAVNISSMRIDNFYTKDYNMIPPGREKRVGVQGGFFVVRPNITRRDEIIHLIKQGDFRGGVDGVTSGWFGSGYGKHIFGSMTIQGFLAYYFDLVAREHSIELHRCRFNQIADNPRRSSFDPRGKYPRPTYLNASGVGIFDTTCRDGRDNCDDVQCQNWPLNDTRVVHYTYCKVPWHCDAVNDQGRVFLNEETCLLMRKAWFDVRKDVPGVKVKNGLFYPEYYGGFCRNQSDYIFIKEE